MSDTRWDLRRLEDRLPEPELDRPAVRLVHAASQAADVTDEMLIAQRQPRGGCRTKVDGQRCRHEQVSHYEVGFEGWRVRCLGCGCREWRAPHSELGGDVAIGLGIALLLSILFWFAVVPGLIAVLT